MNDARHRFRWRVCSSSARYRLRRNRFAGLGGCRPGSAPWPVCSTRRCRRCSARRCSARRRAAPTPACTPPVRWPTSTCPTDALPHAYPRTPRAGEQPSSCRWCADWRGSCPPMCGSSTSAAPQRVSTPGSRRCAGTTSTGCRPPRTASSRRRRAIVTAWPRPLDVDAMADGVARPAGAARLRRVLPPARGRHHDPRPAAAGLVARRRPRHRAMSPPTRSAGRWCARWSARCWRSGSTAANPVGAPRC